MVVQKPVGIGVIGTGWMGRFHAEIRRSRVPGATLAGIADPAPGVAAQVAADLGAAAAYQDPAELLADPGVDAVVIASPATTHADLVVAAAAAGKGVFCEKPMALTLADADRAVAAAADAGVVLQVGFNRRFARDFVDAQQGVVDGRIGTPQLLRSLTRDPGPAPDLGRVKPWTIYYETLIHDFDTLLWLNPGATPVEVYAIADALVQPQYKDSGLLDTSVVTIRFDNGAIAVAEANFSALYGYDVRGEVFGSAGMVSAGDVKRNAATFYGADGLSGATSRLNIELFADAYVAELVSFAAAVRSGSAAAVTGVDARRALAIALACIDSVRANAPIALDPAAVSVSR